MTGSSPATPLASRRILVVDDQPSIRGILELALVEAGASVWTAEDGKSALRTVHASPPELILLDLAMPGMDGWEVIDALAASPQAASIPVVLETSAEDFASFDRARKHGVAAFITKPFRLTEILETCCRILEGDRPLQDRADGGAETPTVEIRDTQGSPLGTGRLVDAAAATAQIVLDTPLGLAQRVSFTLSGTSAAVTRVGEVRWVSRAEGRYHHGLALKE